MLCSSNVMRSFREVAYNFQKPIADLNANAQGAGLGTMHPIINLHAQKKLLKQTLTNWRDMGQVVLCGWNRC